MSNPIIEPELLRTISMHPEMGGPTRLLRAREALRESAAEIERLRHEIAVRDRALEIGASHVAHLSTADARSEYWLAEARAELEREAETS